MSNVSNLDTWAAFHAYLKSVLVPLSVICKMQCDQLWPVGRGGAIFTMTHIGLKMRRISLCWNKGTFCQSELNTTTKLICITPVALRLLTLEFYISMSIYFMCMWSVFDFSGLMLNISVCLAQSIAGLWSVFLITCRGITGKKLKQKLNSFSCVG